MIIYICVYSKTEMNFIKKANILQILILTLALGSCTKEKKEVELKDAELPKHILPRMKPLTNEEPKLTAEYIRTTKEKIDSFYKKNWPGNSANGSFLVAKNGQIIYEKYVGYSNFSKKDSITSTTPLHIASVSKVVTATAVLKLINQQFKIFKGVCPTIYFKLALLL